MKIIRLFLISTFIISLLAGIWAGSFIFRRKISFQHTTISTQNISSTPGKQEGIWLIAADRLNDNAPQIKGVWLMAYINGYAKLKPLPLFPSDNPKRDKELMNSFRITKDHRISPEFWDEIQKINQGVTNYIVFDEVAAVEIINYFGGVTIDGKHLNGIEIMVQSQNTKKDPQYLIRRQTVIMDSLCKTIFNSQPAPDFKQLQRTIKNHILSNLDLNEQTLEWQTLFLDGGHKMCEFPDLYTQPPISSTP